MARRKKRTSGFAGIPVHEPFIIMERHPQVVMAICLTVLSIIAVCVALYVARAYLLPIATALVFSVVLAPICSRIEWFRIPRPVAALFALIFAGAIVYVGFSMIAQPAARWLESAPAILAKAERQTHQVAGAAEAAAGHFKGSREPADRAAFDAEKSYGGGGRSSVDAVASRIGPGRHRANGLRLPARLLLPAHARGIQTEDHRLPADARRRVRTARAFRDMRRRVAGYIVTFSIINLGVGVATGLACWQLGLPEPAMWGGIAALLNFVPFVGPLITMGLLGLAGLATYDTLLQASFPVLAFWLINMIESNAVTPTIMGRRMTLNPLAIILAVSFWTWIWGPLGGLISLPAADHVQGVCDHTPAFRVVGALIGAPIVRDKIPEEEADTPTAEPERNWSLNRNSRLSVCRKPCLRTCPGDLPNRRLPSPGIFTSVLGATAR